MNTPDTDSWRELERLAERGEPEPLTRALSALSGHELAHALAHLEPTVRNAILTTLDPADAAELLEDVSTAQAAELVETLPVDQAAAIVAQMHSDDQADLIGAVDDAAADAILLEMPAEEAGQLRELIEYPPDTAGGLMITELLRFADTATAQDVVNEFRAGAERYADYDVQYSYVVSSDDRLVGVLPLRRLLMVTADRPVRESMIREPHAVPVHASLEDLDDFFTRHEFVGAPVVDDDGRLVGVVRHHDVEAAIAERTESDYLKSQGIVGGEELRTMPLLRRSRRRLGWLSINVVLNILAASVIAAYQDTLSAVIALAVFLPIISDMSGCSGNQAVAVSIRELSLGLVRPTEVLRVWGKEVSVGLINGVLLGVMVGGAALLWKGNPYLGVVVGAALAINTVISVSIGGAVPLLLKRRNLDPALASGPVLTTVTDVCGFFLVLGMATLLLDKLA